MLGLVLASSCFFLLGINGDGEMGLCLAPPLMGLAGFFSVLVQTKFKVVWFECIMLFPLVA